MSNCGFVACGGFQSAETAKVPGSKYTLIQVPPGLTASELVAFGEMHEACMSARDYEVFNHTSEIAGLPYGSRILFPQCVGSDPKGSAFINGYEVTGNASWGTKALTSHGYYLTHLFFSGGEYYLLTHTPRA